jgi:hypothetical protein
MESAKLLEIISRELLIQCRRAVGRHQQDYLRNEKQRLSRAGQRNRIGTRPPPANVIKPEALPKFISSVPSSGILVLDFNQQNLTHLSLRLNFSNNQIGPD